ncbi:hypothetical protein BDW67DRAFT_183633 [Aspergillus spinulosporus]
MEQDTKMGVDQRGNFDQAPAEAPSLKRQPDISLVLEATTAPSSSIDYRIGCRNLSTVSAKTQRNGTKREKKQWYLEMQMNDRSQKPLVLDAGPGGVIVQHESWYCVILHASVSRMLRFVVKPRVLFLTALDGGTEQWTTLFIPRALNCRAQVCHS